MSIATFAILGSHPGKVLPRLLLLAAMPKQLTSGRLLEAPKKDGPPEAPASPVRTLPMQDSHIAFEEARPARGWGINE